MLNKIGLYYHTLKYLKAIQFKYRFYYMLRTKWRRLLNHSYSFNLSFPETQQLNLESSVTNHTSYLEKYYFRFLNIEHHFDETIDWNYADHGKLWVYNLCYFEYLGQADFSKEQGLRLINDFIENQTSVKDGLEPFPISLRVINWIKFLTYHQIDNQKINQSLYGQLQILLDNLEYHLLGNHLLENGFALLFGAYFFEDKQIYEAAKNILIPELNEQILADGAHFELTPMYHQLMLYRVLDCYNLVKNNLSFNYELIESLASKAALMLGWLKQMTFSNGAIPLFNDSANNIAPITRQLIDYSNRLKISSIQKKLKESGYRKFTKARYELIVDVGNIAPDYIPGHAHSDTFGFELYIDGKPFIVDTGISTYEKNERRQEERCTSAHNTTKVNQKEQSEIWGGFRVAKRAKVTILKETQSQVKAIHNGYGKILHERHFYMTDQDIKIRDIIHSSNIVDAKSYIHFHPSVSLHFISKKVKTNLGNITFVPDDEFIHQSNYQYSPRFNTLISAKQLEISFRTELETIIAI